MKDSIKAYSAQKSLVKKSLRFAGFENIKVSNGFYYFSGFATKNDRVIYFSISDVRHGFSSDVLIRTAKNYTDYFGGANNYAKLNLDSITTLANRLTKDMFIEV